MDFEGNNMNMVLCSSSKEQNGNNTSSNNNNNSSSNFAWDLWEQTSSNSNSTLSSNFFASSDTTRHEASLGNALMFLPHLSTAAAVGGEFHSHVQVDPHLTCLKLGKRDYFEDDNINNGGGGGGGGLLGLPGKRGRGGYYGGGGGVTTAARCQVEGCHVALVNAKEYHRRHKVCEMHSKSPKVVVLGLDQRFCQQCSRSSLILTFNFSNN